MKIRLVSVLFLLEKLDLSISGGMVKIGAHIY